MFPRPSCRTLSFAEPRPPIPMQAMLSFSLGESSPRLEEEPPSQKPTLAAAVADRLETRAAFAEAHELERVLIRKIIERGQAEGSIRKDADADATALMAGCALIGIRIQNMIDPDTEIAPVRDALVQSLRARLAPV